MVAQNDLTGERPELALRGIEHRFPGGIGQLAMRDEHRRPRAQFAVFFDGDFVQVFADVFRVIVVRGRMTMKPVFHHVMQSGGLIPVALIIRVKDVVLRIDTNARRRSHAHGVWHELALRRDLERPAAVLGRAPHLGIVHARLVPLVAASPTRPAEGGVQGAVEVPLGIAHRTEGVLMIIIGEPPAGIDGLVQIGFAVLVSVHQAR